MATPRGVTPLQASARGITTPRQRPSSLSGQALTRALGLAPPLETVADESRGVEAQLAAKDTGQALSSADVLEEKPQGPVLAANGIAIGKISEMGVTQAMHQIRSLKTRDSVAFLLYRAPTTSNPSDQLKELEASTPRGLKETSTTKASHGVAALDGAVLRQPEHGMKRDRMTEYMEAIHTQSHLVRKA